MTGCDFNVPPNPFILLAMLLAAGLMPLGLWKFVELIWWVAHKMI